jgi:hypothetical protein
MILECREALNPSIVRVGAAPRIHRLPITSVVTSKRFDSSWKQNSEDLDINALTESAFHQ